MKIAVAFILFLLSFAPAAEAYFDCSDPVANLTEARRLLSFDAKKLRATIFRRDEGGQTKWLVMNWETHLATKRTEKLTEALKSQFNLIGIENYKTLEAPRFLERIYVWFSIALSKVASWVGIFKGKSAINADSQEWRDYLLTVGKSALQELVEKEIGLPLDQIPTARLKHLWLKQNGIEIIEGPDFLAAFRPQESETVVKVEQVVVDLETNYKPNLAARFQTTIFLSLFALAPILTVSLHLGFPLPKPLDFVFGVFIKVLVYDFLGQLLTSLIFGQHGWQRWFFPLASRATHSRDSVMTRNIGLALEQNPNRHEMFGVTGLGHRPGITHELLKRDWQKSSRAEYFASKPTPKIDETK